MRTPLQMLLSISILLLTSLTANASTVLYVQDPFPGTSCASSSCDVIGENSDFDIKDVRLVLGDDNILLAQIATNFRNTTLTPYMDFGFQLDVGDLFFMVDDVIRYGVPLASHGGLIAGDFYNIGPGGLLTAQQALGNPSGVIYRNNEYTWMNPSGVTNAGSGSLSVQPGMDTTVFISWSGSIPTDLADALRGMDHVGGVQFASATCGNDIIEGSVPEPGTMFGMGGGLIAIGVLLRKKIKKT